MALLLQMPSPPPLPGRIHPEMAVPCAEAFDGDGWRFSVDWDGCRALLFTSADGTPRVQAENLGDLTPRFPELTPTPGFEGGPLILDGVIAVLDPQGRPDLTATGLRLILGAEAAAELPVAFLATDLLHVDGASSMGWPLDRRLDRLASVADSSTNVQVPEHVAGRGVALAEAAGDRGLSGLLARRGDAPYHPGVASPTRLRVALTSTVTCVVAGVVQERGRSALLLAEHADGRLIAAGRVDGPVHHGVQHWMQDRTGELATPDALFDAPAGNRGITWLRSSLCASVAYRDRDRDGALLEATLIALRDDTDPAFCIRRTAVQAPADARAGTGFAPTVLTALPLGDALVVPRARS